MDRRNTSGDIKFDEDDLLLDSQSNFSSCRANTCVYRGRCPDPFLRAGARAFHLPDILLWMYEATVLTSGIQQLGWATGDCPFTSEEGVGDAPDSYAYDGKRVKKWNVACDAYGQPWVAGDVIGCCLDMDQGEITFYRNGESMGLAFSNVKQEATTRMAYYPAISLSHGESSGFDSRELPFRPALVATRYYRVRVQTPPVLRCGTVDSSADVVDASACRVL
eukprot:2955242-Pyramimonas_sp.AAC.1